MNEILTVVPKVDCDTAGFPLDWERCRTCEETGTQLVNYGHTVNPDGSLGGRGMRSEKCPRCCGYGSLRMAALKAMLWRQHGVMIRGALLRCEDCSHPMIEGTWEACGAGVRHSNSRTLLIAEEDFRIGREPVTTRIYYSLCDEGCRHGGPGRTQGLTGGWTQHADLPDGGQVWGSEASWRPVDVRTLNGHPHDLRPENLACLCLRCWSKRSVSL